MKQRPIETAAEADIDAAENAIQIIMPTDGHTVI